MLLVAHLLPSILQLYNARRSRFVQPSRAKKLNDIPEDQLEAYVAELKAEDATHPRTPI